MKEFQKLIETMATLRSPDGCPWDREQASADLKACVLEETHEVIDAIDRNDPDHLCEELGDLLLQVVFLAQIAQEDGTFTIREVVEQITDKIVRRHPHVFDRREALADSEQVLHQWERIKSRERQAAGQFLLDGMPPTLPALLKACRLAGKVARVGFDWKNADGALGKVEEELEELRNELPEGRSQQARRHEIGDLLFAVGNLSRHLGIDAEAALQETNARFTRRFTYMERKLRAAGRQVADADDGELESLWEEAKRAEAQAEPDGGDQK